MLQLRLVVPDHTSIPGSVRELVRDFIHSFEQLELLLRLQAQTGDGLSVESLTTELGLAPELCQLGLEHLRASGLATRGADARWSYAPREAALDEAVRALARSYLHQRVELMMLLSDDAVGRVRRGAREMFHESLRWRRKADE